MLRWENENAHLSEMINDDYLRHFCFLHSYNILCSMIVSGHLFGLGTLFFHESQAPLMLTLGFPQQRCATH